MEEEKLSIKLLDKVGNMIIGEISLYEEDPDNTENVLLKLCINGKHYNCSKENYFYALTELRRKLEKEGIQILCNGAAENVYPSGMILGMGVGRKAYKMEIGKKALMKDLIDIFDYDEELKCVSINKQEEFYNRWFKSHFEK